MRGKGKFEQLNGSGRTVYGKLFTFNHVVGGAKSVGEGK